MEWAGLDWLSCVVVGAGAEWLLGAGIVLLAWLIGYRAGRIQ